MIRLETKNCNMILTEKQKTSALSSVKIGKYEFLADEEILPSDQSRIIEQAKFCIFSFKKSFWKANKNNLRVRKKQVKALKPSLKGVLKSEENKEEIKSVESLFPKGMWMNDTKNEIGEIKKWEEIIRRIDLVYKTNKIRI